MDIIRASYRQQLSLLVSYCPRYRWSEGQNHKFRWSSSRSYKSTRSRSL